MFRVQEGFDPTVSAPSQWFVFRRFGRAAQAAVCGKHKEGRLGGVLNERRETKSKCCSPPQRKREAGIEETDEW